MPEKLPPTDRTLFRLQQDFVLAGITMAAILLLIGTGTQWLSSVMGFVQLVGQSPGAISATFLLNIALILFGWRRLRDLRSEILRRSEAEERAWQLAHHDPLTGFLNRRALTTDAATAIEEWRKQGLIPAALMVDIDAFKSINDLFGHASGDQVIVQTAERIRDCSPDDALLARMGGDEFVIVMPVRPGSDTMDTLGKTLNDVLAHAIPLGGQNVDTSSSIGGACSDEPDITVETLMKRADTAMYRAKKLGRCRYERFDDLMGAAMLRRQIIETELRLAIDRDEIFPVYEPVVCLETQAPTGYEMLARWHSPELGEVMPEEFISVAETAGLIGIVADRLFRRAFVEAQDWLGDLSLSVNVSPLQLRDPWFAQKLLKLIAETGFPPSRLIVELTESAIVDNIPLARAVFTSLRNQGIRIALDDFGTGYSSVASLRNLPFDTIKLDREFVSRMENDSERAAVAEAVLKLGQSLGLPVVAEGIESTGVVERLTGLRCAFGQGHYFSKAKTHAEMMAETTRAVSGRKSTSANG